MAEEIWHHGIKGMKWGIRHTPEQLGHKSPAGAKTENSGNRRPSGARSENPHEDYVKAHNHKKVETMSDAELRARLNRLNMEKQYSQMNPSRVERGRKILNATVKAAGTVAAASATVITLKNNWETISGWFGKS